ncbi:hypothetical protein [Bacillus sp. JCM 19041]
MVKAQPIRAEQGAGEILGAVYVEASIEKVKEQAQTINQIFITATTIA